MIVCFLILGIGGGVVAFNWSKILSTFNSTIAEKDKKDKAITENNPPKKAVKEKEAKDDDDPPTRTVDAPKGGAGFPRRALVVSVHNYLYANPTQPGLPMPDTARNVNRFVDRLSRAMRVPQSQIAHLSDAAGKGQARPPIKPVVEKTIADFLQASRPQDRVLLFFVGHAVEVGDEAFLIPLEGELDETKTLIPLKWVYEQLAKCKARQKVFVVDVCRFSPSNGAERPGADKMGAKLDAALKAPPAGVQVWSSCVADQRSLETDNCPMGVFLDSMFEVLERVSQGGIKGIQKPDAPYPLEQLQTAVDRAMKKELDPLELTQTARLVGAEAEDGAAFDKTEKPAPPATVAALPAGTGDSRKSKKIIEGVLTAIGTPPVKPGREDNTIRFDLLPPLSEKALEMYADDNPETPSKLRDGIAQARTLLWAVNTYPSPQAITSQVTRLKQQIKVDLAVLTDGYRVPQAEAAFKNQVFEDEKKVAKILGQLQEAHDMLEADDVKEERDKETKRWQANYDFMLARVKAQIAFLYEYQSMLGQMRKELPPRNAKVHGGWRLAAQATLAGDSVGKRMAQNSRKILDKLAKDHAGTPWEILAKREKLTALGLEWQPTK